MNDRDLIPHLREGNIQFLVTRPGSDRFPSQADGDALFFWHSPGCGAGGCFPTCPVSRHDQFLVDRERQDPIVSPGTECPRSWCAVKSRKKS